MIEGLKPYSEYKESGLPWIPQTPGHWSVNRLRHACKMLVSNVDKHTKLNELPVSLCNYVDVYKNERIHPRLRFMRATASTDEVARFRLRHGDVVITKDSEDWKDIGVPALVEHEAPDFVCGYHLAILRPRPAFVSGDFLLRTLQCHLVSAQFHIEAHGVTRYGLGHGAIKNVSVPIPPPDEQAAIVRFLDHANRKIDGFIRAKRKLIGLLNEQKQAIIHRAVTRGLNPDVPLKPSGIPWLGDIPEHWEVRRAKYLFREVDDRSKKGKETHLAMSQRLGLVPSSMVESAMRSESYAGAKLCQEGDLVLNRLKAHLGVFSLAKQGGVISPDYSVFRKRAAINMEYYESVLKSSACRRELRIRAKGLVEGFWRLYTDDFYDIRLPLPPLDEQGKIMSAMTVETAALTTAITRTEREIALMQEYRTRLTADIVTGKLDVREAAAKLPEVAAEPNAETVLEENETEEGEI